MKKTQRKDATRNVKKRIVSFLSICLVSAFGLAVLLITNYMAAGLDRGADRYLNGHNFKDYEMASSTGISEANVDKIRSTEGVSDAEGVIEADGTASSGETKLKVTVLSMTERVSVPELAEGKKPIGKDECMIGEDVAETHGLKVGDKLRLSLTGLDALGDGSPLYSKEFTITGTMRHPDYFRRNSINTVVLPMTAFDQDVIKGLFTRVFIRAEAPEDISIFSKKYFKEIQPTTDRMNSLVSELEADRTQEMKDEGYATIDEEWAKAKAQLDDGENQIKSGEAQLNSKLAQGRKKLKNGQKTLDNKVAEYEKKIRDGEEQIADYEQQIREGRKALKKYREDFEKEVEDLETELKDIKRLLELFPKDDEDYSKDYLDLEKDVAKAIIKHEATINKIVEFSKDESIREQLEKSETKAAKAILKGLDWIKDNEENIGRAVEFAHNVVENGGHFDKQALELINGTLDWIQTNRDRFDEMEKQLDEAEKKLNEKKKEVAEGKIRLKEEKAKYQKRIKAGWSEYYRQKAKYEAKLAEAKELLKVNREKAEEKLKEAKAEVEKLESNWILLDKDANAGYVDIKSNINATKTSGYIMGILFMLITAIVCFSTLVIIIDEQKELVGTTKAFGFFKNEVLGKYLVFGVLAAIVGSVIGIAVSMGGSEIMQTIYNNTGVYQMPRPSSVFLPVLTIICCLAILAVIVLATVISCSDILRSPASLLMKGEVLKKPKKHKALNKLKASKGGSLYSRLIIRNIKDDKSRVIVTIAIIAFSTFLMGMGMSLKLSFEGMMDRQANDINKYDIKVTMNGDVTDEQKVKLAEKLEEQGVSYMSASVETKLYRWNDRLDGLQLICGDPEHLSEYFAVTDPKTDEELQIPDSGVLIQRRMNESYKMNKGDTLPMLDSVLELHDAKISGYFKNYAGRTVIISPKAYKEVFGEGPTANTFFVKLNGVDEKTVKDALVEITEDISTESSDDFRARFEANVTMFNLVVVVTVGIAILMSFLILTNLANIYLTRKKTELTVMRVNGFTVREAKGYLTKETILTSTTGIVLGVVLGAILTPIVLTPMQQPDVEFVKSFHVLAWVVAVGLEGLFSIIINSMVFRKVKDLNLRDIA